MDTGNEAIAILHDAERSLRDLIQKRLAEQRYGEVASIARLADGLSQLTQRGSESPSPPGRGQGDGQPPMPVITRSVRLATGAPRRPKPPKKKEYPKFVREGDRLVKIGWSKKNKSTYEHKAPYEAVTAVVRQLAARVAPGQLFTIENVLPVPDISTGGEVPAYQVYLTLGWLRALGFLDRRARDGYKVTADGISTDRMSKEWARVCAH